MRAPRIAGIRALMEAPFATDLVTSLAQRTPLRKSVVGPLAPWLLKPASQHLAPLLTAEFNSWRRVGCLPPGDAHSAIALVPKVSSPTTPADFRGIAVGALLAKLYAAGLEQLVSDHAEAAGVHAEGQFGFRRCRSTEQAVLALRTVIDSQRQQERLTRSADGSSSSSSQLWACFVDFKQAYDRIPREQLWEQLEQLGYGGEWLRAVRAIYASVPMSVSAPGLEGRTIDSTQGLKQGCPLSPTLFSLYIADFEQRILEAAQRGEQLDLPALAGQAVPPLMYADDMALLATSAQGLQRQLRILETYCTERGLTVNIKKTKAMLLSGARDPEKALKRVQRARLTYAGQRVEGTIEFKYLGVIFHSTQPLGESAAPGRAAVARFAEAQFSGKCAALGLEATRLLIMLYHSLVDSTLSYGAAVWAPGLAYVAASRPIRRGGSNLSEAELQHLRTMRRLLGVPSHTPTPTVLAEAGELPLYITWLVSAARLWNQLVTARPGSVMRQVLDASMQLAATGTSHEPSLGRERQPWATQLQRAMLAAGVEFDLQQRQQLDPAVVRQAALTAYLQRVAAAAQEPGASRLRHYFVTVRPDCLTPEGYTRAPYLEEVRERCHRRGITELRTGMHWGREERDRLRGAARPQLAERTCPHCDAVGLHGRVEDTRHIIFDCVLYSNLRPMHPTLFPPPPPTGQPQPEEPQIAAFLAGPPLQLARFAGACRRRGRLAAGLSL